MILLIDTINDNGCIGFYDGKRLYTKTINSNPQNNRKIVSIIDDFVNKFKIKNLKLKIESIGVVNGPGAFTGVRTGVTITNAAAYALNVPVYAIDTLSAQIPRPTNLTNPTLPATPNCAISLLSTSNSEVYFARFEKGKIQGKIEIVNVENNLKNRLKKGDYIVGDLKCEHAASLNIQYPPLRKSFGGQAISNIQSEDRIKNLLQMIIDKKLKPKKQALPLYIKKPNIHPKK
uniref:tRNA (Adenosine(37)-N6)-threonylcarbamoyltransferase complex dimerization subunit type 1 TsaB n=1 Tax=candidate division CPR3 bacterium TaxID=2268181 RepID=A0A7C4RAF0_UNCC3